MVNLNLTDQTPADGTHIASVERLFSHSGSGADVVIGGGYNDVLVDRDDADVLRGGGG